MSRLIRGFTYGLGVVVILGGLAIAFHDAIFRWLTLRLVQQVPGLEVGFDGRFDVTHVFPITLDTEGSWVAFKNEAGGDTRMQVGELHLEIRFWQLLRGVVAIEQLKIADADLEIPHIRASATTEQYLDAANIPFIEELHLERVDVRFQLEPDAQQHELNVSRLRIGADENGLLKASGTASLDGDELELTAVFGSPDEFLHPTAPFPVNATLQAPSWGLQAQVSGTLVEPVHVRGAKLDVRATTSDVSPLRDLFLPDAPFGGALEATARISGDLSAPALSNLDLTMHDEERLRLTVEGNVANLRILEGLDLQVEVASQDPMATRYLTGDTIPTARTLRANAVVRGGAGDYRIANLAAKMSGANGLSAGASGFVHLGNLEFGWPLEDAHLDVHLSGAVADLKAPFAETVADAGTLRVKARMDGSSKSLMFSNVEVVLEETRPLSGTMQGELTYLVTQLETLRSQAKTPADVWVPATADVSLDLATADLKSLSAHLGQTLPDLGPVSAKARLRRDGDTIDVTSLDARTTGKRPLGLITKGQLAIADITSKQRLQDVDLELEAKGRNAESVAPIFGPLPIDPGPWSLQARVKTEASKLSVEALKFESGRPDTVRIEIDGKIPDLQGLLDSGGKLPIGVMLEGHLSGSTTERLGALVGQSVPDLGRFDARFQARGDKDDWSVSSASITITDETGLDFKATGKAGRLLHDPTVAAEIELRIPDPQGTVSSIGGAIPQMSAVRVGGRVEGSVKQASFFEGHVDIGSTQFKTLLEVELAGARPHLAGTILTPVLRLGDFLPPGRSTSAPPARPEGRVLSDQRLRFDLLHYADVDFKLIADRIEGERIRTEQLELILHVGNGHLKAHHKKLKYEAGAMSTSLEIDNAADPPKVSIKGRANNISLGALHAQVSNSPELVEGLFSFDVDVTASGHSPHQLFAATNGHYGHVMEDVTITGGDLDLLALGALQLLMKTVAPKNHTTIDCGIAKFKLSNGVATSETLFLHTPKMIAAGTGQLDLGDESVDILVKTEARKLLRKQKTVLRIYGPMRHLKIDADLKQRAFGAAAGTTASVVLPPLGFSVAGLSFLGGFITDGQKSPCIPTE